VHHHTADAWMKADRRVYRCSVHWLSPDGVSCTEYGRSLAACQCGLQAFASSTIAHAPSHVRFVPIADTRPNCSVYGSRR
jgi:hypothetical protein